MDFVPLTDSDKKRMLKAIGVSSFESLLQRIPRDIPRANLKLGLGISEPELLRLTEELAVMNATTHSHLSFLGAGAYDHYIPSVVRYVASRGEFLTAYTPYQAEASQGTLQAMYEYQSLLCDLTGMEVANASLYDGASSLAEGCILTLRETGRHRILMSQALHPEYRQTLRTYLKHVPVKIEEIPWKEGVTDLSAVQSKVNSEVAAVVVGMPNALGCLEPVESLAHLAQEKGALFVVAVNPISLGILKAPGSYGADVVVGEGQSLGNELGYGGPYLGLFACKEKYLRKVPGRIVGMTRDVHGRRGFCLTLQTREQHIRRSKATSNICTNEAMMALSAAVYLSALGKEGFREVALRNVSSAHYLHDQMVKLPGVKPLFSAPFFNEFALEMPKDPEFLNRELLRKGFLGGFPLKRWESRLEKGWLLCATETRTRAQMDRFAAAVSQILS